MECRGSGRPHYDPTISHVPRYDENTFELRTYERRLKLLILLLSVPSPAPSVSPIFLFRSLPTRILSQRDVDPRHLRDFSVAPLGRLGVSQNAGEVRLGWVKLPLGAQTVRFILKRNFGIRGSGDHLKTYFPRLKNHASSLSRSLGSILETSVRGVAGSPGW